MLMVFNNKRKDLRHHAGTSTSRCETIKILPRANQYYGKFIENLSSLLSPLYKLLEKERHWSWGEKQQLAFDKAKSQLTSSSVLMHFDASPYGVGAVLSHQTEEGERPIAFASRTLSPAERKYAHLDKEGLYIIFGVKKFDGYLFGRKFVIRSDHKPLQRLLDNTRVIPQLVSARLQWWSLIFKCIRLHNLVSIRRKTYQCRFT